MASYFWKTLEFVNANPVEPEYTAAAETGDVLLSCLFIVLAMIGFTALFFGLKRGFLCFKKQSVSVGTHGKFRSNKLSMSDIVICLISIACLLFGSVFVAKAFANNSTEENPDTIKVYVDEQKGTWTISDNVFIDGNENFVKLNSISSEVNQDAEEVEGIDDLTLQIKSGEEYLYDNKIGDDVDFDNLIYNPIETVTYSYNLEKLNFDMAMKLVGKKAIDVKFNVDIIPAYYLTFTAQGEGTVSPTSLGPVMEGTEYSVDDNNNLQVGNAIITQAPNSQIYKFNKWLVDIDGALEPIEEGTVSENHTKFVCAFKENTFDLHLSAGEGGSINPAEVKDVLWGTPFSVTIEGNLIIGEPNNPIQTVKIEPENGKILDTWKVNGQEVYFGTISEDCTEFSATFVDGNPYKLTFTAEDSVKEHLDINEDELTIFSGTYYKCVGNVVTLTWKGITTEVKAEINVRSKKMLENPVWDNIKVEESPVISEMTFTASATIKNYPINIPSSNKYGTFKIKDKDGKDAQSPIQVPYGSFLRFYNDEQNIDVIDSDGASFYNVIFEFFEQYKDHVKFNGWLLNNELIESSEKFLFIEETNISADIQPEICDIKISLNSDCADYVDLKPKSFSVDYGTDYIVNQTTKTITFKLPDGNYIIQPLIADEQKGNIVVGDWSVADDINVVNGTITDWTKFEIDINWKKTDCIFNKSGNGTIYPSSTTIPQISYGTKYKVADDGDLQFDMEGQFHVGAMPGSDYELLNWTVDGEIISDSGGTVTKDSSFYANFVPKDTTLPLTFNVSEDSHADVSAHSIRVSKDTESTYEVKQNKLIINGDDQSELLVKKEIDIIIYDNNYHFVQWLADGTPVKPDKLYRIEEGIDFTAVISNQRNLSFVSADLSQGTVSSPSEDIDNKTNYEIDISCGTITFDGIDKKIDVIPATNYKFKKWVLVNADGTEIDAPLTGEINASMRFKAYFALEEMMSTITYKIDDSCATYGNFRLLNQTDDNKQKEITIPIENDSDLVGVKAIESNFVKWVDEDTKEESTASEFTPSKKPAAGANKTYIAYFNIPKAVFYEASQTLKFYCDDKDYTKEVPSDYVFEVKPTHFSWDDMSNASYQFPTWCYEDGTPKVYASKVVFDSSFKTYEALESTSLWFADNNAFLSNIIPEPENNDNLSTSFGPDDIHVYKPRELSSVEGLENVYTHNIKETAYMFAARLSPRVSSSVIDMLDMLEVLDFSTWIDMPYLINTSGMFLGCTGLSKLTLPVCTDEAPNALGSNAKDMRQMFAYCSSVKNFILGPNFGQYAENMQEMFAYCDCAVAVNVGENTKFGQKCHNMNSMFICCTSLTSIDLSAFSTPENNAQINFMLRHCFSICSFKIGPNWKAGFDWTRIDDDYIGTDGFYKSGTDSRFPDYQIPSETGYGDFCRECGKAVYCKETSTMSFYYDHKVHDEGIVYSLNQQANILSMIIPSWYDTDLRFNSYKINIKASNLVEGLFGSRSNISNGNSNGPEVMFKDLPSVINMLKDIMRVVQIKTTLQVDATNVVFDKSFAQDEFLQSTCYWFGADSNGYQPFTNFTGFENINTKMLMITNCMFGGINLESVLTTLIDQVLISSFASDGEDAIKMILPMLLDVIEDIEYNTDFSNYDTYGSSIKTLDLTGFDPNHNLKSYIGMFANCSALESVTLPENMNPGYVPYDEYSGEFSPALSCMFYNCKNLKTINNLSGDKCLDTTGVVDTSKMFAGCTSLESLDLSYFNMRDVWRVDETLITDPFSYCTWGMFDGCINLTSLSINKDWNVPMTECWLHDSDNATEKNPWTLNGKDYKVEEIPGLVYDYTKEVYNPTVYGEFKRGPVEVTQKTVHISTWPQDSSTGTVSVDEVKFVNDARYYYNENGLVVAGQTIGATPSAGNELKYWTISDSPNDCGTKIQTSHLGSDATRITADDTYIFAVFDDANLKAKAIYDYKANEKTLKFVYDTQTHEGEGEVFEVYPNTYINSSFYLFAPYYLEFFGGMLTPMKVPAWDRIVFNESDMYKHATDIDHSDYLTALLGRKAKFTNSQDNRILPLWDLFGKNSKFMPQVECTIEPSQVIFANSFKDYAELESISMWFMADQTQKQTVEKFYSEDENGNLKEGFSNLNTRNLNNVQFAFGGFFYPFGVDMNSFLSSEEPKYTTDYARYGESYGNAIESLDMTDFDFSHIKDLSYMFANSVSLHTINFGENVDTSSAVNMDGMFANCESLVNNASDNGIIGLDKFVTSNVSSFRGMFYGCSGLESLDLSSFNTEHAITQAFTDEGEIKDVNICEDMFKDCKRLNHIKYNSTFNENKPLALEGWTINFGKDGKLEDEAGNFWHELNSEENGDYTAEQLPTEGTPSSATDVHSGEFVRNNVVEYVVHFDVDPDGCGTINGKDSFDYKYIESASVKLDQYNPSVLWCDNKKLTAAPTAANRFKYWAYGDGFGEKVGSRVQVGELSKFKPEDDGKYTFKAVFDNSYKTAKAVFTHSGDKSNPGYMSFYYDNKDYTVGQDNVIGVYPVYVNTNDYNFPAWYTTAGESSYSGDNHYLPRFKEEIEVAADLYNINFDVSFKEFDELASMSCWFMPGISQDGKSVYEPFRFDQSHFAGLQNIETRSIVDVRYMFGGHHYFNANNGSVMVTEINLSDFDQECRIQRIDGLFANCLNLKSITLPKKFATNKLTSLSSLFYNCNSLDSENLEKVLSQMNTSNVTDMSYMFSRYMDGTPDEKDLQIITYKFPDNFDTSKVETMEGMFNGIKVAKGIILVGEKFDTTNVKSMRGMFASCINLNDFLSTIGGIKWHSENVTDMAYMFYECKKLEKFNFDSEPTFSMDSVKDCSCMFRYCNSLQSFSINKPRPSDVKEGEVDKYIIDDARFMFEDCYNLTDVDLAYFTFSKNMFPNFTFSYSKMFTLHNSAGSEKQNDVIKNITLGSIDDETDTASITLADCQVANSDSQGNKIYWLDETALTFDTSSIPLYRENLVFSYTRDVNILRLNDFNKSYWCWSGHICDNVISFNKDCTVSYYITSYGTLKINIDNGWSQEFEFVYNSTLYTGKWFLDDEAINNPEEKFLDVGKNHELNLHLS